jgi:hypothetical protein
MSEPMSLVVRTADQTRRAELTLDGLETGADILPFHTPIRCLEDTVS